MSGPEEATGELNIWTHSKGQDTGPEVEPSLRGQKCRSLSVSGTRIAAITDQKNGRVSWFPSYQGWSSASSGGNSAKGAAEKENSSSSSKTDDADATATDEPQTSARDSEEERVAEALSTQLGRGRPSDIALGAEHVLVAVDDGRVFAWGRGEEGQLGLPHALGTDLPAEVKALTNRGIVLVSAGRAHSAAVTHDGGLYTWGSNAYGQGGLGKGMPWSSVLSPRFVHAFLGIPVSMVSCGHNFTACVTGSGEVWTWGEGGSGQLGVGRVVTKCNVPQLACGVELTSDGAGFSTVSCGWGHCLAVSRTTGQMYSWGLNSHGQLGLGDVQKRVTPTIVSVESTNARTGVTEIVLFNDCTTGGNNSMALTMGVCCLYSWGSSGRCHGGSDMGHVLSPRHVSSTGVSGYGAGLIGCSSSVTAAFSPTSVRQVQPSAGPTDGGSEISIVCDGVWHSEKILVRFSAILTGEEDEEECVEMESGRCVRFLLFFLCSNRKFLLLLTRFEKFFFFSIIILSFSFFPPNVVRYDPETGAIVCVTPPWPLDEQVLVEVTVNGYDFTSDGLTYTFYNPPTVHGAWPPYGFSDVSTTVNVFGTSLVDSEDLSVRFRPHSSNTNGEEVDGESELKDFVVPARFLSKGQVSCQSPNMEEMFTGNGIVECSVDVAINGKDFTDAGVVFTFHGFQPMSCVPCCAPRKGSTEVVLDLPPDVNPKHIDEDGLRVKIDFGGQRSVEVPCKVKGKTLKFKTPKVRRKFFSPFFLSFFFFLLLLLSIV